MTESITWAERLRAENFPEGPFPCGAVDGKHTLGSGKVIDCHCYGSAKFQAERRANLATLPKDASLWLSDLIATYPEDRFALAAYRPWFQAVADKHNVKLREVAMAARLAVMGQRVGMPLFESMVMLGEAECVRRMTTAMQVIQ